LVTPEDDRYPFTVRVDRGKAQDGDAVVVAISDFTQAGREMAGRIAEVLGDPADLLVQTEMTIRSLGLPHRFSAEVEAEVAALDPAIVLGPGRADLRAIPHVTIDGETARDFDDAVAVEEKKGGYRLYVSIADVGHYVRPGTALDHEAYQRGTSVYFPNKVVPMLPERLSNDLCSLVPGQDRLAFTAIIDFDRKGHRQDMRFTKSVIKSRHRLTYTKVKAMVADKDAALLAEYRDITADLTRMAALARQLEKQRLDRGSIGFEIPEAAIVIDEAGHIAAVRRLERNLAHKLIEEFMLAANEAVAEALADRKAPTLYRIHEQPDATKVEEFATFTATLGLRMP
jgi:ribonuclease R